MSEANVDMMTVKATSSQYTIDEYILTILLCIAGCNPKIQKTALDVRNIRCLAPVW